MISFIEYAELAASVYDITLVSLGKKGKLTDKDSVNRDFNSWYLMTDVDFSMLPTNHFKAGIDLQLV